MAEVLLPLEVRLPEQNKQFIDALFAPVADISFGGDFMSNVRDETQDIHRSKIGESRWQEIGFTASKNLVDAGVVVVYEVYFRATLKEINFGLTDKEIVINNKEKELLTSGDKKALLFGYSEEEPARQVLYEEVYTTSSEVEAIPSRSTAIIFMRNEEVIDRIECRMPEVVEILSGEPAPTALDDLSDHMLDQLNVYDGFDRQDVQTVLRILRYLRLLPAEIVATHSP